MAPLEPVLTPLQPSVMPTMAFPSELRESSTRHLDPSKPNKDEPALSPITPPPAYTKFLDTFGPIFASKEDSRVSFAKYMGDKPRPKPTSVPSSTTTASLHRDHKQRHPPAYGFPCSPAAPRSAKSPTSARRLRIPPPYALSPASATYSPRSAYSHQSPYSPSDWRMVRAIESPMSETGEYMIREVVTTTITLRRAPQLGAPPRGKRRRNGGPRST